MDNFFFDSVAVYCDDMEMAGMQMAHTTMLGPIMVPVSPHLLYLTLIISGAIIVLGKMLLDRIDI